MSILSSNELTFSVGLCATHELASFISFIDKRKDEEHTRILQLKAEKWGMVDIRFSAIAIVRLAGPTPNTFIIGTEGNVIKGTKDGFSSECIDDSLNGPKGKGWLRHARAIGSSVYAVGMSRQVYGRPLTGTWERIDEGMLSDPLKIVGFNDIDGPSEKEIYAVGLDGEIWVYDGVRWSQCDSQTNIVLNRVRATPNGIYVCGNSGSIVFGQEGHFRTLPNTGISDNFYGLEWFNGHLYVATLKKLFVLSEDKLKPVDFGFGDDITTGFLTAADGILWSIGAKHLLRTSDGTTWEQVEVKL